MDIASKNTIIKLQEAVEHLESHSVNEISEQILKLPEELLEKKIKEEAKKYITKEDIEIKEVQALVYTLLGLMYFKEEEYELAKENYCKALKLNKNAQPAYSGLLKIYVKNTEKYSKEIAKILVSHGNKDFSEILATKKIRSEKNTDSISDMENLVSDMLDVKDENNLFYRILQKHNINMDSDKNLYKECKEIFFCTIKILSKLLIDEYSDLEISHYTRKSIAYKLLLENENTKASKFRMHYTSGMNDPTEGKTLLSFLEIEPESDSKLPYEMAFIASFTSNIDSLNQFRLYGKENDKEATGVSIVFKDSFFGKTIKDDNDFSDEFFKNKSPLYQCVYIDLKKQAVFIRRERKVIDESFLMEEIVSIKRCSFNIEPCRTEIESALNKEPGLSESFKATILNPVKECSKQSENYFEQKIISCIIMRLFFELKEEIRAYKLDINKDLLLHLLVKIRYLVKDCAFAEEEECRTLKIKNKENSIKDKSIALEGPYLYIDTSEIKDYVSKIYYAPLAEGMDIFEIETGIECIRSRHPYKNPRGNNLTKEHL